jgi:hypothetical protein
VPVVVVVACVPGAACTLIVTSCFESPGPWSALLSGPSSRYLDLSPGPGTGQERRFTIDEVVLIAITADLTKLGLTVGAAAHAANMLPGLAADGHRPPVYDEDGWTLVIGPSPAPAGIDAPTLSPLAIIKLVKPGDLQLYVQMDLGNAPAVVTADISVIARRTADRLKDAVPKKKGRPRKI